MTTVELGGLSPDAVATVLRQIDSGLAHPDRLAGRLYSATGGNVFFVLEVVRELLETGLLATDEPDLPLPQTVQDAVLRRAGRLGPLAQQVSEVAAVLSPHLKFEVMVNASGRAEMEVAEGLEMLADGQLLATDAETFRFHHDLAREAIYQNIRPWRRRLLHRRAAESLANWMIQEDDDLNSVIATHFDEAGERMQAIIYYREAATTATALYAHLEAIGYLKRTIELCAEDSATPDTLAGLHEMLGDSLFSIGQHKAAEEAYETALAQVRPDDLLLRVTLQSKIAETFIARHLTTDAERFFDLALETMGPFSDNWPLKIQQSWLKIQLSRMNLIYLLGDLDRQTEIRAMIEPVIEIIGKPVHHVDFMKALGSMNLQKERYILSSNSVEIFLATLAAARETGDVAQISLAQFAVGFSLLWSGKLDQAALPFIASLEQAEEAGIAYTQVLCLTYLTCLYRFLGNSDEARRYGERSLAATEQVEMPTYLAAAHANLAWLALRDGLLPEARREAEQALTIWGDYPYPFRWLASWVLLALHTRGREFGAAAAAAQAILRPGQRPQPGELPNVLESAVAAWDAGDEAAANDFLKMAVELATQHGYL
jgi:predicted ATPase